MTTPLHIVMTPTRNEAWVIRAFMESTTRWADYIIVCDQMSTDGTREIVQEYAQQSRHAEVILIDNPNPEFNEAERQEILIRKAREIAAGRDTLLWGLDADEIIAANAFETEDLQRILHSQPGAVFWFQWAQLTHDKTHYFNTPNSFPWLFHDDGKEPHKNYVREMHSMRIPYPLDEHDMTYVNDFRILHLGPAPLYRVHAKERFYIFVDWQLNHRSPCTLWRTYIGSNSYPKELFDLPTNWVYTQEKDGWDLWNKVNLDETHCWMDDYIYERLHQYPMDELVKVPIWTPEFMTQYNLSDPRPLKWRVLHRYLRTTQPYKSTILIRAIDRLLFPHKHA